MLGTNETYKKKLQREGALGFSATQNCSDWCLSLLFFLSIHFGLQGGPRTYLNKVFAGVDLGIKIRRPLRCRRVRFMLATPNTTNTHKSLFYEILQQPDTTITTDTTGSLILPLPPILPVVI